MLTDYNDNDLARLILKRFFEQHKGGTFDTFVKITKTFNEVMNLFSWADTKEGYYFWRDVNQRIGYNVYNFVISNLSSDTFVSLYYFI